MFVFHKLSILINLDFRKINILAKPLKCVDLNYRYLNKYKLMWIVYSCLSLYYVYKCIVLLEKNVY